MIKQVLTYDKFLKDLCTVERGLNIDKKAFLIEQVSAIIQCKTPIKYKDLSCPTISVNIEGTFVEKALLDLGASVNQLPYSVYKQMRLGELKPTTITLSLADRSVKFLSALLKMSWYKWINSITQWTSLSLTPNRLQWELTMYPSSLGGHSWLPQMQLLIA